MGESVGEDEGPRLVVGLGNPGPDYAGHRHNVGVMVLDVLGDRVGGRFAVHRRSNTEVLTGRLAGHRVVLARPRTYMNTSGGPVAGVAAYHSVDPGRIIVIHDELDIPYDTIRLKLGGGDNGHNGLRSVTRSLGTNEYLRVRVGIGRPPGRQDPADFVLRDFSAVERKDLGVHLERAADAVEALLADGLVSAQNTFHG